MVSTSGNSNASLGDKKHYTFLLGHKTPEDVYRMLQNPFRTSSPAIRMVAGLVLPVFLSNSTIEESKSVTRRYEAIR